MCIIDHYPLGNQRTEILGGLNISIIVKNIYKVLRIETSFSELDKTTHAHYSLDSLVWHVLTGKGCKHVATSITYPLHSYMLIILLSYYYKVLRIETSQNSDAPDR